MQLLVLASALGAALGASVPATAARWTGRTLRDEAGGAVTWLWEGVTASVTVAGASTVSAALSSAALRAGAFRVYVDGADATGSVVFFGGAAANYTLAAGLSAAPHTVTLYYVQDPITFSWPQLPAAGASLTALAFSTDGAFLAPPPELPRRLLFIGDSITAGNQINATSCADDHSGTYERHLCDALGANCTTLAISGIGLYANCAALAALPTMPALARRALVGDAASAWDDALFRPDGVFVALGTNDQGGGHAQDAAWVSAFTAAYADFLVALAAAHGRVPLFLVVGPITHDYFPWVAAAADAARARGVGTTVVLNATTAVDRCGHPDYDAHAAIAASALPVVRQALGW